MTDPRKALAAEDLRTAARYIDEVGHHRGNSVDPRGSGAVCALGGLAAATGCDPQRTPYDEIEHGNTRYIRARKALQDYLNWAGIGWSIPTWSDLKAKDKADVTATMEKAAAWIEEQA
jgi:hypothetical protein